MASISIITDINEQAADKLRQVGVRTSEQLIEKGATSTARMRLADETGLDDAAIKCWVHQADLLRIPGMTAALAKILCDVGVCTVPKLAYRSSDALYHELQSQAEKVRQLKVLPTLPELHRFSVTAKQLPKFVYH